VASLRLALVSRAHFGVESFKPLAPALEQFYIALVGHWTQLGTHSRGRAASIKSCHITEKKSCNLLVGSAIMALMWQTSGRKYAATAWVLWELAKCGRQWLERAFSIGAALGAAAYSNPARPSIFGYSASRLNLLLRRAGGAGSCTCFSARILAHRAVQAIIAAKPKGRCRGRMRTGTQKMAEIGGRGAGSQGLLVGRPTGLHHLVRTPPPGISTNRSQRTEIAAL
jgi:hypothetical protein